MSKDRKLCGLLNEMRLDGSLCDAVLRVDEVDFKVHKNILSAYSPYFRALFTRCSNLDQRVHDPSVRKQQIVNLLLKVMNGCLYVIGGCNDEGTTSRCEYYDVYKDEWFKIQNMNSCHSAVSCCVVSALPNVTDYTTKRDLFL
ncbi:hypothetical protein Q7C36_002213 [Tachysurus vachellii]|uniref:BTB domain-containing protein n=1 Tax=Tachysurus vachellii TaxID=175792 RepID=A0AA88NXF3_TACVA|nr:hypothetical protein Q7C36_002213 [Tachysurus vachellii]